MPPRARSCGSRKAPIASATRGSSDMEQTYMVQPQKTTGGSALPSAKSPPRRQRSVVVGPGVQPPSHGSAGLHRPRWASPCRVEEGTFLAKGSRSGASSFKYRIAVIDLRLAVMRDGLMRLTWPCTMWLCGASSDDGDTGTQQAVGMSEHQRAHVALSIDCREAFEKISEY